eukprot:COSAG01_NODE_23_length_37704_cov_30.005877_40_plen_178_part_00
MVFFYGGSDGAAHRCAPPSEIMLRTDDEEQKRIRESQSLLLIHSLLYGCRHRLGDVPALLGRQPRGAGSTEISPMVSYFYHHDKNRTSNEHKCRRISVSALVLIMNYHGNLVAQVLKYFTHMTELLGYVVRIGSGAVAEIPLRSPPTDRPFSLGCSLLRCAGRRRGGPHLSHRSRFF